MSLHEIRTAWLDFSCVNLTMTTTFPSGTFEFISGRVIVDAEDLENWRRTPGMFLSLPEARSSPCVSFPSLETREVTFMFLLSNGFPP